MGVVSISIHTGQHGQTAVRYVGWAQRLPLFAHLLRKYGDVSLAILAYHDGETRMDRVLAGGGTIWPKAPAANIVSGWSANSMR